LQEIFQELPEIAGLSSPLLPTKAAKRRKFPVISLINGLTDILYQVIDRSPVRLALRAQPTISADNLDPYLRGAAQRAA
jgi:hypothetical protein